MNRFIFGSSTVPLTVAVFLNAIAASLYAATSKNSPSLKGKSDQELVAIVHGKKRAIDERWEQENEEDRVRSSSLDFLWEMPPREAALALAKNFADKESQDATFKLDDPKAKPPKNGEIGIRYQSSGHLAAAVYAGVTILKYDGYKSQLLTSIVELAGQVPEAELEGAVMKTDSYPLRRPVAQQTYEMIWWLRHVRFEKRPQTSSGPVLSNGDSMGTFWMRPSGPNLKEAFLGRPCGQCVPRDEDSVAPFADMLIRRVIERSGIKQRFPIPKVGQVIDHDEDAAFLRTQTRPGEDNKEATTAWIGRLVGILHDPARQYLYSNVMEILVPLSDPLRYHDTRIDEALLDVLHRSQEAAAKVERNLGRLKDEEKKSANEVLESDPETNEKRRQQEATLERSIIEAQGNAIEAAAKLGLHDAISALPEILQTSPKDAAAIVGRHPELRSKLIEFLRSRSHGSKQTDDLNHETIEIIWRGDLRDLGSWLDKIAGPASETIGEWLDPRHEAKIVLLTWREPDAVTKTKLDILLTGEIGRGGPVPEILRNEFENLSTQDKVTIRNFVSWMRTIEVGFSRYYIENFFTPHTPRPDIPFEH